MALGASPSGGGSWPAANRALYVPFNLPYRYLVRRAAWTNGSTPGGNWDIGFFSESGTRLWRSGTVAGSGQAQPQWRTLATPLILEAGVNYWFGVVHDVTTAQHPCGATLTASQATEIRELGAQSEDLASTALPAQATFAPWASQHFPLLAFTFTASGL